MNDIGIQKASDTKRRCAYCDMSSSLTREHIWPGSIIRRVGERASYNPRAGRLLWTEMVISDVCGSCNNGPLSKLDVYGVELYERYFGNYYFGTQSIDFVYDYQRLAKWLLKLSFNAARANRSDSARLARYAPFLIDPNSVLPNDFSIAVDLVLPAQATKHKEAILPASNRICRIDFTKPVDDWCTVRMVAINSYYFWILIQDVPDKSVKPEHAKAVISKIPGVRLDSECGRVALKDCGTSLLKVHQQFAETLKDKEFPKRR